MTCCLVVEEQTYPSEGELGEHRSAFIIGVLANGLNLLNVSPFYQDVAKGAVILAAVLMDKAFHSTADSQ